MSRFNPNHTDADPNPEDDVPPDRLRFLPVLFSDPERVFAYLAIHTLGWSPKKFVADCRELTLKELEKLFEAHLIWRGFPRSLVRHMFQSLRNLLRKPPVRGRKAGDDRPLNDYYFREFLTDREADDVSNWSRASEARLQVERERAMLNDPKFDEFWSQNRDHLFRVLPRYIRGHHTTPEDIVQLTWLAIQIAHDTGAAWDFGALRRVALDLCNREPCGRGLELEFLDEIFMDRAGDDGAPMRPIPVYVKIAVLHALFDGKCLPHEILALLCRQALDLSPGEIVKRCVELALFDLNSEVFAAFLRHTSVPEPVIRKLCFRLDRRLSLPFRRLTSHGKCLNNHRDLRDKIAGWTLLSDYFKKPNEKDHPGEVSHWMDKALQYLKKQARKPGTLLFLALLRWHNEDPDFDALG